MRRAVAVLSFLLAAACAGDVVAPDGGNGSSGSSSGGASFSDAGADGGPAACEAAPVGLVSLPADDAQHDDAGLEWWYWTGHLEAADGGAFGFEEVFFREIDLGTVAQLGEVALTDVGGQRFRFGSSFALGNPAPVANGFFLSVGGSSADGGDGHDQLHGAPQDATFDLQLDSVKAPVLQGGTGYITYPDGGWTYYYSRELLHATGTVTVDGQALPVTGEAWFDHQWGNLQAVVQNGWEWFSIQLDDDRDLMLNWPLTDGGLGPAGGSISDADCNDTVIGPGDVTLTALGSWTSPHTGCSYPMGWQIDYRGLSLTLTPDLEDQELYGTQGPTYWEGSCTVSGSATGKAYAELNGFCP